MFLSGKYCTLVCIALGLSLIDLTVGKQQNTGCLATLFGSEDNSEAYCAEKAAGCIKVAKNASKQKLFYVGQPVPLYVNIADEKFKNPDKFAKAISQYPTAQFFPNVGDPTILNFTNAGELINNTRHILNACCLSKSNLLCTKQGLPWIYPDEKIALKRARLIVVLRNGHLMKVRWEKPFGESKPRPDGKHAIKYKNLANLKIQISLSWEGEDGNNIPIFSYYDEN